MAKLSKKWNGRKYGFDSFYTFQYFKRYNTIPLVYSLPTDVQAEAIPLILGGGDVLMAAETGSGKTGAFCLPIMQIVWETLKDFETGKAQKVTAARPSKYKVFVFSQSFIPHS